MSSRLRRLSPDKINIDETAKEPADADDEEKS